ncbi:DUF3079 domain-containing protein [Acidovorax sp. GBBC 3334]|uniref:DUF3079 domain-containing protein n=1 Tax=unclassified Acidovorax TaxID=2684926 RepID=UPI002302E141|nr:MULTISPECIES: DUF3079 domain-containing protein [unclassified Acidovorax]MDA8454721.1 DUF3079 domain-containing protein [Acidovorax sp. GBBC 3334]MDA8521746.1 DUF3079 domain-containing protein [Acidovorax sp. NCPPB 4044]
MQRKFPDHPAHPERICWGCDRYCPAGSMACGNGSDRTQHPVELFGDDWRDWEDGRPAAPAAPAPAADPCGPSA